MPSPLPLFPGSETLPRLEVIDVGDHRTIQIGGHPVGCYRRDDVGSERVVATQLAEALTLDACEIAAAFGMHPVTLSRLRGQFRAAGSQALMPHKHGPKGPTKLTGAVVPRDRAPGVASRPGDFLRLGGLSTEGSRSGARAARAAF